MAAIGNKMIAKTGMLVSVLKTNASRRMDTKPANCDQNKDLKDPICFEKTPPRKSYIPHPNMPPIPNNMLKMVVLMNIMNLLYISTDLLVVKGYGLRLWYCSANCLRCHAYLGLQ